MSLAGSYTFVGNGNWSLDAVSGQATGGGTIDAVVPSGSRVERAFLYETTFAAAHNGGSVQLGVGASSTSVSAFQDLGVNGTLEAYRADVTSFVSNAIGSGSASTYQFNVSTIVGSNVDGYALVVVYSNPNEQLRTIALLDGFSASSGDSFTLNFSQPLNPAPSFSALLSLGIGFSYQPSSQYSNVTVNNRALTASAGGQDDGVAQNGGLITIGGIGDDPANPADPTVHDAAGPRADDELYNLALGNGVSATPFLTAGTTSVIVNTLNPSRDDNIFFAGFNITQRVTVSSNQNDAPVAVNDAGAGFTTTHGVAVTTASVLANDFDPDTGDTIALVGFDATGLHGTLVSNANGTFTYTPNAGFTGIDSFTYTIRDNAGLRASARVDLTVTNAAPVAVNDAGAGFTTTQGAAFTTASVLANDVDPDTGDTIALVGFDATGLHGTLVSNANGTFTYTPNAGFTGVDSFTYAIQDSLGLKASALVDLTVNAPTPTHTGDTVTIAAPAALQPGATGAATVTYHNSDGVNAPALVRLAGTGLLIADPLTGQFSDSALILQGRAHPDAATYGDSVTVKMAASQVATQIEAAIIDPAARIDWSSEAAALRPEGIGDAAWARALGLLQAEVGATYGSLTTQLLHDADKLDSFGLNGTSATAGLAFELDQALDFGTFAARDATGSLGRGWAFIGDAGLSRDGDTVIFNGLADLDALTAPSLASLGQYSLSDSVGRGIDVGAALTLAPETQLRFTRSVDGSYTSDSGLTLTATATGYSLRDDAGRTLAFDTAGRLVSATDAVGQITTASYDAAGHVTGLAGPQGSQVRFTYDATGKVTGAQDATGQSVGFAYDAAGRLASERDAGGTSAFSYTAAGDLAEAARTGRPALGFDYDAFGRLGAIRSASGDPVESYGYDDSGGYTTTDAAGRATHADLLPGGIVGGVTDASGLSASLRYDAAGRLAAIVGPDGTQVHLGFDAQGRVASITDGTGATLAYGYAGDAAQPATFTDADGHSRAFTYTVAGQIAQATWTDGTTLAFSYDAAGQVVRSVNRRGEATTYDHDAQGHVIATSQTSAGGPASYGYDAAGRLASVTTAAGATDISYDAAGQVTGIAFADGHALSYQYDAAGRRTAMSDQDGHQTLYGYDAAGRLASVTNEAGAGVRYGYDASGLLTDETNSNGTTTHYGYDAGGRVADIVNRAADGSVTSEFHYGYDAAGHRSSAQTSDGTWSYAYDAAGQLTHATFASTNPAVASQDLSYTYDAAGNRISATENGVTTAYEVNALNQYVAAGATHFAYDADGNMVSRTDATGTTSFAYDADNRIASITSPTGSVTRYDYDAFGNRSGVTVDGVHTSYLVDPFGLGNVVDEYGADGSLSARYLNGLGLAGRIDATGATAFYDLDATGSVVGLTNAAGGLANSYAYAPFGTEIKDRETIANAFEFNGGLGVSEDTAGLLYMRAREYDPQAGRFTSEDPLWLSGDVGNLYRSDDNNPVSYADPSGENLFGFLLLIGAIGISFYKINQLYKEQEHNAAQLPPYYDPTYPEKLAEFQSKTLQEAGKATQIGAGMEAEIIGGVLIDPALEESLPKVADAKTWFDLAKFLKELKETFSGSEEQGLDESTTKPENPRPAKSDGDPHLTTFDGLAYDFQAVGEFTLLISDGFEIQTRQQAAGSDVAVNTAAAMRIGDDVVGIYARQDGHIVVGGQLVINGQAVALADGETIAVGGGSVYRYGTRYEVVDAHGDGFWVNVYGGANHLRPFIAPDEAGHVAGLLGNADGNRTNDIALRDGTVIAQPVGADTLYGAYADSWRIDQAHSLFVYGPNESTATFTDRDFPHHLATLADLTPDQRAAGEAAAYAAGLQDGTIEFMNAVLDVGLTGNPDFAVAAASAPQPVPDATPLIVTPAPPVSGPSTVTVDGGAVTPGPNNVVEGNGGFRDDAGGSAGNDVFQGEASENYYFGGAGSDTFIIGQRYLNADTAIGGVSQKTVDVIFDFHGAAGYEPDNDDFVAFSGFAAGSAISIIASATSSNASEPDAMLYYYSLHDAGTGLDYILAIRSVNGQALTTNDYAFY